MASSLVISHLVRHREHLPLLESWFLREWPAWYGPGGPGDVRADLHAFAASEHVLPVGLVVLRDGVPIAVGALKAESLRSHRHLGPWAAAGYVVPGLRRHGIGARLLEALVRKAGALGFAHVYCGTATAVTLLQRNDWEELERVDHDGESIAIFRKRTS